MDDEKPRSVWAVTVGENASFMDEEAVRERLEQLRSDDRPFQPIANVIGAQAAGEVADEFVGAIVDRASIPRRRSADLMAITSLDCTPEDGAWRLRIKCYGHMIETDWDGTVDDARSILADHVRDLAGDIKGDRGRASGRHAWDD